MDKELIVKAMEHCANDGDCNDCPYCELRATSEKACAIIIDSYLLVKELMEEK